MLDKWSGSDNVMEMQWQNQVHGSFLIDCLQCPQELKQSDDDIFIGERSVFAQQLQVRMLVKCLHDT